MSDMGLFATLRNESAVVPGSVRKFAKVLVIGGSTICVIVWLIALIKLSAHGWQGEPIDVSQLVVGALAFPIVGAAFAGFSMLLGYVYGDARRRGMPAGLWVLLVLLIPNMIGFIVYFILRRGIFAPCSNCGRSSEGGQIYCSACGHKLEPPAVQPQPSAN